MPCDREAVLAGGLRGSDKGAALAAAGLDPDGYFLVSVDVVLREMARRSLIPVVARLSPLDGAALVHDEARFVAKRLAARAVLVHGGQTTQVWDAQVTRGDGRTVGVFRCTQLLLASRRQAGPANRGS